MRLIAAAVLGFALAACGSGNEGSELAAGNSELSPAQIDAALGPADQSTAQDAVAAGNIQNGVATTGNDTAPSTNSAAAEDEDE